MQSAISDSAVRRIVIVLFDAASDASPRLFLSCDTPPADLTTLARRHGGKFPEAYVTDVLRTGVKAPAHGTSDMPVWGPLFGTIGGTDQALVNIRITNLVIYLKSLQVKDV